MIIGLWREALVTRKLWMARVNLIVNEKKMQGQRRANLKGWRFIFLSKKIMGDFVPRHLLKPKRGHGESNLKRWRKKIIIFLCGVLHVFCCHSIFASNVAAVSQADTCAYSDFFLTLKICNLFAFGKDLRLRRQISLIFILWGRVCMMSHQWKQKWYCPLPP